MNDALDKLATMDATGAELIILPFCPVLAPDICHSAGSSGSISPDS